MAAIGHIEFLTFDRIALEYCVIPLFDQFECTDSTGMTIFTNQCNLGVKTRWLPSVILNFYVLTE